MKKEIIVLIAIKKCFTQTLKHVIEMDVKYLHYLPFNGFMFQIKYRSLFSDNEMSILWA